MKKSMFGGLPMDGNLRLRTLQNLLLRVTAAARSAAVPQESVAWLDLQLVSSCGLIPY